MKSGFIELVVKRVIGGRAIKLQEKTPRYRAIDSFKKYMTQTLPEMQQSIQINMLKKNLAKIKDGAVRNQLINAYLRRLFRLRTYEKQEIKSYKQITNPEPQAIGQLMDPTIIKNVNDHTEYDIGFYCLYSEDDMMKAFKHGCFGRYTDQEWGATHKFGIQIREQSISIAAILKLIQQNVQKKKSQKQPTWSQFKDISQDKLEQIINNEQKYPLLFMELAHQIYKYAQKYRSHVEYNRVWGSSVITDIITNSILQNKVDLDKAVETAQTVVDAVMNLTPLPAPNDFSYRFKTLPGSTQQKPIKTYIQLPTKAQYYCRTPSFTSLFLGGQGGTGKSMIMAYLSMFAFKNGWIIVNLPNAYKWTQARNVKYVRAYNGLYLIQQHAVQWLDQFITANKETLEKRQIDESIYGKCDITGTRDDQAEPVPNLYIAQRRTYFNEIGDKFKPRLLEEEQQFRQQAKKRLTNILKKPKNMYQIGVAGIKNPQYATCAMGQILRQVYTITDVPILECVDSYSYLFRPSYYASFRYYNDRDLWGKIPPYHLAHCRLFILMDGHKIANGLKIVASSNYPMYKHKFSIKQMMFPENYEHKVRNLNQSEFKNAGQFNILNTWWMADEVQRLNINYAFTISQGNWGDFQELIRLGHYY